MSDHPRSLVQSTSAGFPFISTPVHHTSLGTPYLQAPGVTLISKPDVNINGIREFLEGYGDALNFPQYLDDPTELPTGAQLCKTAGQLCYASFGPKRSMNSQAQRYFNNIKDSGHGSVLEHAAYSFMVYGISRSVTHEAVRHRAGFGFSQLSQRYVSGRVLRFVERPEYVNDPQLHSLFERRIDLAASDYNDTAEILMERQKSGSEIMTAEHKTDLRKKVQQAARSLLPNEAEAPMVITGNARAWRHFIEMRANEHAETEIRAMAFNIYLCLSEIDGYLFGDYETINLPDGTFAIETAHRKV